MSFNDFIYICVTSQRRYGNYPVLFHRRSAVFRRRFRRRLRRKRGVASGFHRRTALVRRRLDAEGSRRSRGTAVGRSRSLRVRRRHRRPRFAGRLRTISPGGSVGRVSAIRRTRRRIGLKMGSRFRKGVDSVEFAVEWTCR